MSDGEELRAWISGRRRDLYVQLLDQVRRGTLGPLSRNRSVSELARLDALEKVVPPAPQRLPNWRWGLLSVGLASLLLAILTLPVRPGELALSAEATGMRLKPAGILEMGPKHLVLEGFPVEAITDVTHVGNLSAKFFALDQSGSKLSFSGDASLAALGCARECEIGLETSPSGRLVISLDEAAYVSVTPNTSKVGIDGRNDLCANDDKTSCITLDSNIRASGNREFKVHLRRTADPTRAKERDTVMIRIAGKFALLAFDVRSARDGLRTGRDSHLRQASVQLKSFGDETLTRHVGQSLRLSEVDGFLDIGFADDSLKVHLHGESGGIFGNGGENLTPSTLAWLWKNKTIALYFGAFLGIFGFMIDKFPKAWEWMRR